MWYGLGPDKMRDNKKGRNAKGYYPNIDLVWLGTWLRRKRSDWYDSALWWFWGSGKIIERVVQPKEKTENEENHKGKVSGMDAAMAHRERKQLNFSTIVDFSLSKQGIFFVLEWRGFEQPVPAAAGRKSARWFVWKLLPLCKNCKIGWHPAAKWCIMRGYAKKSAANL